MLELLITDLFLENSFIFFILDNFMASYTQ
jgi:hypothetical protein